MSDKKIGAINSVNTNEGTDFPYLVLSVINGSICPDNQGFGVMHWHSDLQFIYVTGGKIALRTLDAATELSAGEGAFINRDVIHMISRFGECRYKSFVFPDRFLCFYPGSPAERTVAAVSGNAGYDVLPFRHGEPWQESILESLKKLSELHERRGELYEYEVLVTLCGIWLGLAGNLPVRRESAERSPSRERLEVFLRYIERNSGGPVTLAELADSAHVSVSECLRCFKSCLRTTPYRYLEDYRLSRAARLLRDTDMPVQEISAAVGFGGASHFGKRFREKTGFTPREYRRAAL